MFRHFIPYLLVQITMRARHFSILVTGYMMSNLSGDLEEKLECRKWSQQELSFMIDTNKDEEPFALSPVGPGAPTPAVPAPRGCSLGLWWPALWFSLVPGIE